MGYRRNTLVAFMQDNGHRFDGKNTIYEGGIRVSPTFVSWPAGQEAPGRRCDELVSSLDFVPTFLETAGIDPPEGLVLDGISLMPIIRGTNQGALRESLYAEMGHTRAVQFQFGSHTARATLMWPSANGLRRPAVSHAIMPRMCSATLWHARPRVVGRPHMFMQNTPMAGSTAPSVLWLACWSVRPHLCGRDDIDMHYARVC